MIRLLLVTLLTISTITLSAPILPKNVTIAVETTTRATTKPTDATKTFIFPSVNTLNASAPETHVVVETGDDNHLPIENDSEDSVAFVDLVASNPDSDVGENKIETHQAAGAAPKIIAHVVSPMPEPLEIITPAPIDDMEPAEAVPSTDDEDFSETYPSSEAPVVVVPTTKTSTARPASVITPVHTYEASITSPETLTTPKHSSVKTIMKTLDNDEETGKSTVNQSSNETERELSPGNFNETAPEHPRHNADLYPKSTWDKAYGRFVDYTKNHPNIPVIVLLVMFVIVIMLVLLVSRECCKSQRGRCSRRPSNPRYQSVTADLYNTSSCSQYYTKPMLLPNQTNVTMQLLPSDVSTDIV